LALANAVVPEMMRQGWGRIVNVTTSLGTMLNAGSPTYGPSKAALEALSAIMAKDLDGTGVTVNVLVPGGVTDTPMISDEAGFDRAKMIQPHVMVPPLLWLVSEAAGEVTGRRFLGVHSDAKLPPEQAAEKAGAPVAWTSPRRRFGPRFSSAFGRRCPRKRNTRRSPVKKTPDQPGHRRLDQGRAATGETEDGCGGTVSGARREASARRGSQVRM
jgi:hypothetical protein